LNHLWGKNIFNDKLIGEKYASFQALRTWIHFFYVFKLNYFLLFFYLLLNEFVKSKTKLKIGHIVNMYKRNKRQRALFLKFLFFFYFE
jgi:hypothetical protein